MQINSFNPQYTNRNNRQVFKAKVPGAVKKTLNASYDKATDVIAKGIGETAAFKPVQKLVDFLKDKNYQEHLAACASSVLSGFYMLDTAKSKTIEKDQKLPLIMNQGAVWGMSTIGAYTLNHYINKKINHAAELFSISKVEDKAMQEELLKCKADYNYITKLQEKAKTNPGYKEIFGNLEKKFEYNNDIRVYIKEEIKKHKNDEVAKEFLKEIKNVTKTATQEKADVIKDLFLKKMKDSKALKGAYYRASMNNAIKNLSGLKNAGKLPNMINGFKTAKALMIFALIYRFASPVIATPLANKVSERLEAKKKAKLNAGLKA